jgi:hypothetical protein
MRKASFGVFLIRARPTVPNSPMITMESTDKRIVESILRRAVPLGMPTNGPIENALIVGL